MRIIAGRFRSRKLKALAGSTVRPTPDRLRESLFNVLAPEIEDAVFLDAYAGTGAVGFEALSRGAKRVVLFERDAAAMAVIKDNIAALGVNREVTALQGRATALYSRWSADIAFVDPPYELISEYTGSLAALSETSCRLVIAQHASRTALEDAYGSYRKYRTLRQGDNSLSFYSKTTSES